MEFINTLVFQLNYQKVFLIVSLALQILGTVILAWPLLQVKRDLDDDLIISTGQKNKKKYLYTRKGFIKDRKIGLWGLGLLSLGFLIQLLLTIL